MNQAMQQRQMEPPLPDGFIDISERSGVQRTVGLALKRVEGDSFDLKVTYREQGKTFTVRVNSTKPNSGLSGICIDLERPNDPCYAPFVRVVSSKPGRLQLLFFIRPGPDGDSDGGCSLNLADYADINKAGA